MNTTYIFRVLSLMLFLILFPLVTFGSEETKDMTKSGTHTEHPPHSHEHHDHIKKLDEAMMRRRKQK